MAMGIWLKETLREKGMTIKQLSELSGVSINTLYSITKRDTEKIDPVILRQIKKAIGLDKTELEPCPFCGGEAKTSNGTTDPENKFHFGWVGCQKCRCFINYVNNNRGMKEATDAWNRRTPA